MGCGRKPEVCDAEANLSAFYSGARKGLINFKNFVEILGESFSLPMHGFNRT